METETACARFFNTPELLDLLASALLVPKDLYKAPPADIASLCRTSRRIHEACTPVLYRKMFISCSFGREQKVLASIPCLVAFGRNIHHLRMLQIGPMELLYYSNCLLAFEELRSIGLESHAASQPQQQQLFRPNWLPPAERRICQVIPLPPMTNLQYLYITDDTDVACSYKLPNVLNDRVIMAHLCWLIFLNPRLRWLDSYYDPVVDIPGCRLLAKAISGLSQLTTLEITIFCREELRFQVGAEIFFNCCPSIRKFKVVVDKPHYENRPQDWDLRDVGDTEWMVASRKEEPLTNLEDLELWEFRDSTSTENLLPVFAHCPNLKKLTILALSEHYNHDVIGRFIGKACPKLESLTFGSEDFETRVEGPLLLIVMESLPAQQVRDIYFQGVFDGSQASPHFSLAIQQHSKTLQTIQLTSTRDVTKISVAVILEECINLKVLIINGEDYNEDGSMCGLYATLSDLLERPWNAVKLTRLSLSVSVCDILIGPADPPVVLSEIKEAHSSRLEEMYQRAKALKDLRDMSLDVMVLTEDEYGELSFRAIEEPLARSEESEESEESDDDD